MAPKDVLTTQRNRDVCTQFGHCYCIPFNVPNSRHADHDQCCMCYHQRPADSIREKALAEEAMRRQWTTEIREPDSTGIRVG